jgi:hypothetical protein
MVAQKIAVQQQGPFLAFAVIFVGFISDLLAYVHICRQLKELLVTCLTHSSTPKTEAICSS